MKKYEKPTLLYEKLNCNECLCACAAKASALESMQCGFAMEGTPYTVFLQDWVDCLLGADSAPAMGLGTYCYQSGVNNIFSS